MFGACWVGHGHGFFGMGQAFMAQRGTAYEHWVLGHWASGNKGMITCDDYGKHRHGLHLLQSKIKHSSNPKPKRL